MSVDLNLRDLAKHVLSVGAKHGIGVTNMQLQKVLFFVVGMSIRHDLDEVDYFGTFCDGEFERWRYGPVVPGIYYNYNRYGDRAIEDVGEYFDNFRRFDNLIARLLSVDVTRLIRSATTMKSWLDYEDDILNGRWVPPYSLTEIVRDFSL